VTVEKEEIPVVATVVDRPCRVCKGTGWIGEKDVPQTQKEKTERG
jgi:hypothetical protein